MKKFYDREIAPAARKLGELLVTSYMPVTRIQVTDKSSTQSIYVRTWCNHVIQGGECIKCRIVIEDDPRDYLDE